MKLATCIHQFFNHYLPHIKGAGPRTIQAYRETFNLFLPFAARHCGVEPASLKPDHLSSPLVCAFLIHLESQRRNSVRTRNHRLAVIKSFARMLRLMYPDFRQLAESLLALPEKRARKQLVGFLYPDEVTTVFDAVDLKSRQGFRDYTILHLLYDSGARATEIATLDLDYFDPRHQALSILGKGNKFRSVTLLQKTTELLSRYIHQYRIRPNSLYSHRLFINQQGLQMTRHGIYRICRRFLSQALDAKRLKTINPVHSFRHSCAMNLIALGRPISDVKNRLGHESIESTMHYLSLDMTNKKSIQKKFLEYARATIADDPKIDDLIDWENKEKTLDWLDSL